MLINPRAASDYTSTSLFTVETSHRRPECAMHSEVSLRFLENRIPRARRDRLGSKILCEKKICLKGISIAKFYILSHLSQK